MRRADLLGLLAAAHISEPGVTVLVVGSQSVLGAHEDSELPERATLSPEADVMYLRNGAFDEQLTEMVDAYFGEGSAFHEAHGVYLQGVDESTCVLPDGWRLRLVTLATPAGFDSVVRCLDPHDLAVAKLAAGRPKDTDFVYALLRSGHLDHQQVLRRTSQLDPTRYPGSRADVTRRLSTLVRLVNRDSSS